MWVFPAFYLFIHLDVFCDINATNDVFKVTVQFGVVPDFDLFINRHNILLITKDVIYNCQ